MYDMNSALNVIRKIKQDGIELIINDYGTKYSSLSSLRHFPQFNFMIKVSELYLPVQQKTRQSDR